MKKSTLILAAAFFSVTLFGQTTEEEYNYLTKGYKVQIESGLDMKKGYEFKDLANDYTQFYKTISGGFSNRFSLYSWKHTGAVRCVKSGMSLKSLQLQMRHHSLDQLNEYLRELGVLQMEDIKNDFPLL